MAFLDWEAFAFKFRGDPQIAFETLAYHMFCRKYHITEGLPSFYNQKHIETNPYYGDDGSVVGFQAKYYSTPLITAVQKDELIKETLSKTIFNFYQFWNVNRRV